MDSSDNSLYVGIEVTRKCNLHCPHCFTASSGQAAQGLPADALERLISELAAADVRSIAFSGGEPLIRTDLAGLIHYAHGVGIQHVGIVTNGFFAVPARVRELKEAGLNAVQISLDGVDATDHCAVRGAERRDFYRALRAVRAFLDAGIDVHLATILSPENLRRAPEMAMFAEALGVGGLRYCTFVPAGRARDPQVAERFRVTHEETDRFLEFMRSQNRQAHARLQIIIDHGIGPWRSSGEFKCVAGSAVAYISAEGDLYPCPGLIFDAFKIGNVLATNVSELLTSPAMAVTRAFGRSEIRGPCGDCPNTRCSGGCRGAAYARTGSIVGEVEYCGFASSARLKAGQSILASVKPPGVSSCSSRGTPRGEHC